MRRIHASGAVALLHPRHSLAPRFLASLASLWASPIPGFCDTRAALTSFLRGPVRPSFLLVSLSSGVGDVDDEGTMGTTSNSASLKTPPGSSSFTPSSSNSRRRGSCTTQGNPESRANSASSGLSDHNDHVSEQQRLWSYLFKNVNRAVDELYFNATRRIVDEYMGVDLARFGYTFEERKEVAAVGAAATP